MLKNINILESCDYIWNQYEKCIQISTNMPGIGLEICETKRCCTDGETNGHATEMSHHLNFRTIHGITNAFK